LMDTQESESLIHDTTCFPRRVILAILWCLGLFVVYILRVILSVAAIPICADNHWDDNTKGIILSAFYWGYITTQLPAVWLIQRFGAKIVLGVGIFFASAFTGIVPWISTSLPGLIVVRILTGIAEGVSFPAVYTMAGEWVPKPEKSFTMACLQGSVSLGTVFALGVGPQIVSRASWEWSLWISAILGIGWTIPWGLLVTKSPQDKDSFTLFPIGPKEAKYIIGSRDKAKTEGTTEKTPWLGICTNSATLALMWNHFACNWGTYVFISWLPTYLKEVLKYDMNNIGMVFSIIPYLSQPVIALLTGYFVDTLVRKEYMDLLSLRKWFQGKTCFLSASGLVLLAYLDIPNVAKLVLVLSVISCSGFALGAGYTVNFLDLTGAHSGALMAVSNTLATVPGIAGVYLTGFLKKETGSWNASFLLAAAIYVSALYSFMLWAKADQIDFSNGNESLNKTNVSINEMKTDPDPNEESTLV